jgi:uncharacterized membrane protein YgaE (UPF0421/DUF939 family)
MKPYIKLLKIAVGSAIAILIANALGLKYETSAGIITLLTIQDTKKETLLVSLKRIAAFGLAAIMALTLFTILPYHAFTYGLFLLLFVGSCYFLKLHDAIAMNAVLATHYLIEQSVSFTLIQNEALLLLIGAGIGTLLNLFMVSNVKLIRHEQSIIEADLKTLLSRMATYIVASDKSDYTSQCFAPLEGHINLGLQHAYTNMNNTLFQESQYYIRYMELRKQQFQVLRDIYDKICSLENVPEQAHAVAAFIKEIAASLAESNNAKGLLAKEDQLFAQFKLSPLPTTREEFEDRAVLYMILIDFSTFLKMKENFADSLTKDQQKKYWSLN